MSTEGKHTVREPFGHGTQLELKYCERCGGLWLRELGCGEVYCILCVPAMEEFPSPKKPPQSARRGNGPRLPQGPDDGLTWDLDDLGEDWDFWPTAGEQ